MDLHLIIVIGCVFFFSLLSFLLMNKFSNKTYEQAAAEKKAYVEKFFPRNSSKIKRKITQLTTKNSKKLQQGQRKQHDNLEKEDSQQDSDGSPSVESQSIESSPTHSPDNSSVNNKKQVHVEFSEPEIINEQIIQQRRLSVDKMSKKQVKKQPKNILINKMDPIIVKENLTAEPLNHFDIKPPKDIVELKKQQQQQQIKTDDVKSTTKLDNKKSQKPKSQSGISSTLDVDEVMVPKDFKHLDEKPVNSIRNDSPKLTQQKTKQNKKNLTATGGGNNKGSTILAKLDSNDCLSVQAIMSVFNRAELNRNDIQILIDYLLNKQQDTPAIHSEWSDDIVQKLRRQLNEKEKLLQEEQEASAGIQAKLRDLRTEINTERIQFNATIKAYVNDIEIKKNDIVLLQQELHNIGEKNQLERAHYQTKVKNSTQELVQQTQSLNDQIAVLQNENMQKTAYIAELQRLTNASSQAVADHTQKLNELNSLCQERGNRIHNFESQLNEYDQKLQKQQYDLDLAKKSEAERDSNKVEIRNLQNALETTKSELSESKQNSDKYFKQFSELKDEIGRAKESSDRNKNEIVELNKQIEHYKSLLNEKDNKFNEIEKNLKQLNSRELDLIKQLQDQKEKNNELRTKNWKLVEALQNAETLVKISSNSNANNLVLTTHSSDKDHEQKIRNLLQRLCADVVSELAASALSTPFDQWVEQVISTHIKKIEQTIKSSNNRNSDINTISSENCNNNHNHHINTTTTSSNNKNSNLDPGALLLQNAKLKAQVDELTKIVTKTENMLINLETKARDQDSHWRSVVQSKQEEINLLKNYNGEEV